MITFPSNPKDGETVVDKVDDYVVIVWTYSEDKNEWTSHRYGPVESYVFTDQVFVRDNVQELPEKAAADPSELLTQRDVNYFLNDNAGGGEIGPQTLIECTRIAPPEGTAMTTYEGSTSHPQSIQTRGSVESKLESYATKDELAALQEQVDNLSGLLIQARYEQGTGLTTRPGQFICVANDTQQNRFSQGTELRLYESDLDQKAPALMRVIVGDYIAINESTTGLSCQLHVTYSAGTVIRYDYMLGTLDRISDRVPYEFRISGQA